MIPPSDPSPRSSSTASGRVRRSRSLKVFVIRGGELLGPFSGDEVRRQLVSGQLSLRDHAWHNRLAEWVRLDTLGVVLKVTSPTKYEMPPAPPGVMMRLQTPDNGKDEIPVPEPSRGFLRRLFGRNKPEKRPGEAILRRLNGGHFEGVTLAPGQMVNLACRQLDGQSPPIRIAGLLGMRLDGFSEINRIRTVRFYPQDEVPGDLLALVNHQRKPMLGALFRLSCESGCELLILFDPEAMGGEGWVPTGEPGDE